jgi:hypothetical protein
VPETVGGEAPLRPVRATTKHRRRGAL